MKLEQKLESKVIDALGAKFPDQNILIRGAWQAASGKVKGVDDADDDTAIAVAISPAYYELESAAAASFTGRITLAVRRETDADCTRFMSTFSEIDDVLKAYRAAFLAGNIDDYFSVANEFAPAFFRIDGGDGPTYDASNSVWSVTLNFTLRGVIL